MQLQLKPQKQGNGFSEVVFLNLKYDSHSSIINDYDSVLLLWSS